MTTATTAWVALVGVLLGVEIVQGEASESIKAAMAVTMLVTVGLIIGGRSIRRHPGLGMAAAGAASVMLFGTSAILTGTKAVLLLVCTALTAILSLWSLYRMMDKDRDRSGSYF